MSASDRAILLTIALLVVALRHWIVNAGRSDDDQTLRLMKDAKYDPNDDDCWMAEIAAKQGSATHGRWFIDRHGRRLILRGVNLSGSCKSPMKPFLPSYAGANAEFFDDLRVCFVGRPFPIEEADQHLALIKSWGFNVLRLLITWEAIEHFGPGIYDDAYVDYLIVLVRKATKEYGLHVFIDPHQDVWSRHCGGSGAPNWTLRLVGLDARAFYESGAALCHSSWTAAHPDLGPEDFPKMIWPTNYFKLACATMFTLFFGGKTFAPKFVVSPAQTANRPASDRVYNVQDFLTFHFTQAMGYVAQKLADAGLNYSSESDGGVLGWDTFNEPDRGWIGCPDITEILPWQELRVGATPTPLEALRAGIGETQSVQNYKIAWYGPTKCGKVTINQNKVSAWRRRMTPQELFDEGMKAAIDARVTIDHTRMDEEGFQPSDPQPPMQYDCVWASHGVYDPKNANISVVRKYFKIGADQHGAGPFTEHFWMPFVLRLSRKLRSIDKDTIIFLEPPPYVKPPNLVDRSPNQVPAWFSDNLVYTPHWYDGLTLLMRRYSFFNLDYLHFIRGYKSMMSAICLGNASVHRAMRDQLRLIQKESEMVGTVPTLIGEIGIPFNMPTMEECAQALNANFGSLERTLLNATLWNYCPDNDAVLGDLWNGEDLSLVRGGKLRLPATTIRPFPRSTSGVPLSFKFDPNSAELEFSFESQMLVCIECSGSLSWKQPDPDTVLRDSSKLPPRITTEIFFPDQHYSDPNQFVVRSTDIWIIDTDRQVLKVFIGHPRVLSDTAMGTKTIGSCCDACLFPTDDSKLFPLRRKHVIELFRSNGFERDGSYTPADRYCSWSNETRHMRDLNKLSVLGRFLHWMRRTLARLRLCWRRLRDRQHTLINE